MKLEHFANVQALILDVDGVLTNGKVLVTEEGNLLRSMSIRDGYALKHAVENGLHIIVISGGTSEGVRLRLNKLGIANVFLGVKSKDEVLQNILFQLNIDPKNVMAMGDDLPDLKMFDIAGYTACPSDAAPEIIQRADYVSKTAGGDGCVREVINLILSSQNRW